MDKCNCNYSGATGSTHKSYCKLFGKISGTCVLLEVEEPKPECDHIVGQLFDCLVDFDTFSRWYSGREVSEKEMGASEYLVSNGHKAVNCMDCGIPIDWAEIEKKLNLNKDE